MSELDVSELAPIQEDPTPETPPEQAVASQTPPDDPDPTEGLQEATEQVKALQNALSAARGQLRELKPVAQQAQQLQQQVRELEQIRPYAEFVKNNPHLLQPQQPAPVVQDPNTDPQLVSYAKRFDLYTAEGKPDVERAKAIIDDNKKIAQDAAREVIAPIEHQTHETRAVANLNTILGMKDAEGKALDPQHIQSAVMALANGTDQRELIKMLADPRVAEVVGNVAMGLQARSPKAAKPAVPVAPQGDPLHVETAGGRTPQYEINAAGKRMAQIARIPEKVYTETARQFNPNGPNTFD